MGLGPFSAGGRRAALRRTWALRRPRRDQQGPLAAATPRQSAGCATSGAAGALGGSACTPPPPRVQHCCPGPGRAERWSSPAENGAESCGVRPEQQHRGHLAAAFPSVPGIPRETFTKARRDRTRDNHSEPRADCDQV